MFSHVFGVELEILNLCCMAFLPTVCRSQAPRGLACLPLERHLASLSSSCYSRASSILPPALSISSPSSLSAPVCLSGVPAPWPSQAKLPAGHRSSYSRAAPLPSWSSSLCSPHGRTDRAAVMATLADGAAEARGPLSSTAAGQRRGRARPPPGPGKPPQPHLLLPSSFLERPLAVVASPWKPLPPVPHAHVASPPHSSSGRAEGTIGCARDRTCSPPLVAFDCRFSGQIRRSPVPPLLPDPVRDPVLEFDKGKGPNCIVIDSSE